MDSEFDDYIYDDYIYTDLFMQKLNELEDVLNNSCLDNEMKGGLKKIIRGYEEEMSILSINGADDIETFSQVALPAFGLAYNMLDLKVANKVSDEQIPLLFYYFVINVNDLLDKYFE